MCVAPISHMLNEQEAMQRKIGFDEKLNICQACLFIASCLGNDGRCLSLVI